MLFQFYIDGWDTLAGKVIDPKKAKTVKKKRLQGSQFGFIEVEESGATAFLRAILDSDYDNGNGCSFNYELSLFLAEFYKLGFYEGLGIDDEPERSSSVTDFLDIIKPFTINGSSMAATLDAMTDQAYKLGFDQAINGMPDHIKKEHPKFSMKRMLLEGCEYDPDYPEGMDE